MRSFNTLLLLLTSVRAFNFGLTPKGWSGSSSFQIKGTTGVAAMQLAVTTNKKLIVIDRVEANPLTKNGTPLWAAELDIASTKLRGLPMVSNSFCAGGSWLKDGRLLSLGGDPYTGYGAKNGLQSLRFFTPCDNGKCQIKENPAKVRMIRPRWYPSSTRLQDGSVLITSGVSNTHSMTPENTMEFYPRKGNNALYSQFLKDTLKWNLFPHAILLTDGCVFVAANNKAMIYDWQKNKEQRLPNFPDNVRVNYPFGAGAALLPLTASNKYQSEVVFCGGTSIHNKTAPYDTYPAHNKCYRMVLTPTGIQKGWASETAPDARIMGNFVHTPTGALVWINGAGSGTAGYYSDLRTNGGYSSALNPRRTPYLYDPSQPSGKRWSQLGVSAKVNRMYHSVASLLPDGRIITAGSNPSPTFTSSKSNPFPTELRIEFFNPPYTKRARPSFSGLPKKVSYGQRFAVTIAVPSGLSAKDVRVTLQDLGFSTHGINYNERVVVLDYKLSGTSLTITAPPNANVYPPGPGWVFVTVGGVPSSGQKVLVG